MNKVVDIIVTAALLFGTGYGARELVLAAEKAAVTRIKKGLSSSEKFAQKLTGEKLDF